MKAMLKKFWSDEAGFVVTVEMILVATILVIGLVSGLAMLRDAVLSELSDTANAFGAIDQSYVYGGASYDNIGASNGFGFVDALDGSDFVPASGLAATGLVVAPSALDLTTSTEVAP